LAEELLKNISDIRVVGKGLISMAQKKSVCPVVYSLPQQCSLKQGKPELDHWFKGVFFLCMM